MCTFLFLRVWKVTSWIRMEIVDKDFKVGHVSGTERDLQIPLLWNHVKNFNFNRAWESYVRSF